MLETNEVQKERDVQVKKNECKKCAAFEAVATGMMASRFRAEVVELMMMIN